MSSGRDNTGSQLAGPSSSSAAATPSSYDIANYFTLVPYAIDVVSGVRSIDDLFQLIEKNEEAILCQFMPWQKGNKRLLFPSDTLKLEVVRRNQQDVLIIKPGSVTADLLYDFGMLMSRPDNQDYWLYDYVYSTIIDEKTAIREAKEAEYKLGEQSYPAKKAETELVYKAKQEESEAKYTSFINELQSKTLSVLADEEQKMKQRKQTYESYQTNYDAITAAALAEQQQAKVKLFEDYKKIRAECDAETKAFEEESAQLKKEIETLIAEIHVEKLRVRTSLLSYAEKLGTKFSFHYKTDSDQEVLLFAAKQPVNPTDFYDLAMAIKTGELNYGDHYFDVFYEGDFASPEKLNEFHFNLLNDAAKAGFLPAKEALTIATMAGDEKAKAYLTFEKFSYNNIIISLPYRFESIGEFQNLSHDLKVFGKTPTPSGAVVGNYFILEDGAKARVLAKILTEKANHMRRTAAQANSTYRTAHARGGAGSALLYSSSSSDYSSAGSSSDEEETNLEERVKKIGFG
jgi:hypothetical protein